MRIVRDLPAPTSLCFGHMDTDLCSASYDTIDFTASDMCLACGGGQVIQDMWYKTEEAQVIGCDDSMWDDRADSYGDYCMSTFQTGVVSGTTTNSHQTICAACAEVVNKYHSFPINQQEFALTQTKTKSTPMDSPVPISTLYTTTRTSRTTVRHRQIHRSSLHPVCVVLVEGVRVGLLE